MRLPSLRFSPSAHGGWRARALVCWLALLVVLGPMLGRMHSVLHLPPVVALAQPTAVQAGPQPTGTLAGLFQHHAVLDCWEFEQLGHDGHDLPLFVWHGAEPFPAATPAWQCPPCQQPHRCGCLRPERRLRSTGPKNVNTF